MMEHDSERQVSPIDVHDQEASDRPTREPVSSESKPTPKTHLDQQQNDDGSAYGTIEGIGLSHSYVFHPSNKKSANQPLIVFFNGGPFVATTSVLLPGGTGPYTTVWEGQGLDKPIKNPASWTDIGHLLYWDGFLTGWGRYSDEEITNAISPFALDALNAALTTIRFSRESNLPNKTKIVIVAESYGAFRMYEMRMTLDAVIQMSCTDFITWFSNRTACNQDQVRALLTRFYREVRDHFDAQSATELSSEKRILSLFPAIILIQPGVWFSSKGGPADTRICRENITPPKESIERWLLSDEYSRCFFGAPISAERRESYSLGCTPTENFRRSHWKTYPTIDEVSRIHQITPTFLTDAKWDEVIDVEKFLASIGFERPKYDESNFGSSSPKVMLCKKDYLAGHVVSYFESQKLHDDIKAWMASIL